MSSTETALFGIDVVAEQPHPMRPAHYLLISREIGDDAKISYGAYDYEPDDYDYTVENYDDLARARQSISPYEWEQSGIFDNWTGEWIDTPDFADDIEMLAEGSAPYAARPADHRRRIAMTPIILIKKAGDQ
jgi:hypothetical protein